jgi:ferredoxin
MIDSVCQIYFSPTQTTKGIIGGITEGLNIKHRNAIDLTCAAFDGNQQNDIKELAIIGAPVYGGRIPAVAASRMAGIKGNGIPAIIVVVYGNRAFEDALLELKDIVSGQGFRVIAAAAFIGEHSLSSKNQPIAEGRPDRLDTKKAIEFGKKIRALLDKGLDKIDIKVPGNFPYREIMARPPVQLITDESLCIRCNTCITVCPVEAIPKDNPLECDGEKCLRCAACIKACLQEAKALADPMSIGNAKRLFDACQSRKEPELFLP